MDTLVSVENNIYGVHPDLWRWDPDVSGLSFSRFLADSGLPSQAQESLREFTPKLLGRTKPPTTQGNTTALVIGKVQSGKTSSFLALAALASDNGYRVVILLSGTKNVLKSQTHRQVMQKLSRGTRGWRALGFDPGLDHAQFEAAVQSAASPIHHRTLIITVLKRTRSGGIARPANEGIDRLVEYFEMTRVAGVLRELPVLIIDDEADEASLDNSASERRRGNASAVTPTSSAIARLRSLFSNHVFVQYTATPQANLLVELSAQLSPEVCELLPPGNGYCGAQEFFGEGNPTYRAIPPADELAVTTAAIEPPETLCQAILVFYVGATLEELLGDGTPETRSMLVHPSRSVNSHSAAAVWVHSYISLLKDRAREAVELPAGRAHTDLVADVEDALSELSRSLGPVTVEASSLIGPLLQRLEDSEIRVVNSERELEEDLDWGQASCWIFIGGDVLQRGFAMNGLTVTWMPRTARMNQVDVLMQRGRWFGYRQSYFAYCRVWLTPDTHDNYYLTFADHEVALWRSLGAHLATGRSMQEWRRVFWLDPSPTLRLCRTSSQWFRLQRQSPWAYQMWVPDPGEPEEISAAARNGALVEKLLTLRGSDLSVRPGVGLSQTHLARRVLLSDVASILKEYSWFGEEIVDQSVVLDAIAVEVSANPQAEAMVVSMRPQAVMRRSLRDGVPVLRQLAQGRGKQTGTTAASYPGDSEYRGGGAGIAGTPDVVTVQVFQPRILSSDGAEVTTGSGYLNGGCPVVGVYLPETLNAYRRERSSDRV